MSRRQLRTYRKNRSLSRKVFAIATALVGFVFCYLVLREFAAKTIVVGSTSMAPTLEIGDRLIGVPIVYGSEVPFSSLRTSPLATPSRGELVMVRPPFHATTPARRLLSPFVEIFTLQRASLDLEIGVATEDRLLIRRVVGLPGDAIRVVANEAYVRAADSERFVSEHEISEVAYETRSKSPPGGWDDSLPFGGDIPEVLLQPAEYFVMSDDRGFTNDSRFWGAIRLDSFLGRVVLRYWPLRSFGVPG